MHFDLIKSIVLSENRQGRRFKASPAVLAYINERLDREGRNLTERTVATEHPTAYASSTNVNVGEECNGDITKV